MVSARRNGVGGLASGRVAAGGGVVVGVGSVIAVERLASQEGCARLVVSNFGEGVSRVQRLGYGNIKKSYGGGEAW